MVHGWLLYQIYCMYEQIKARYTVIHRSIYPSCDRLCFYASFIFLLGQCKSVIFITLVVNSVLFPYLGILISTGK